MREGGGKKEKEGGGMKDGEHLIYDVQLPSSDNSPAFLIIQVHNMKGGRVHRWNNPKMVWLNMSTKGLSF